MDFDGLVRTNPICELLGIQYPILQAGMFHIVVNNRRNTQKFAHRTDRDADSGYHHIRPETTRDTHKANVPHDKLDSHA